jgi:hypothetical protein
MGRLGVMDGEEGQLRRVYHPKGDRHGVGMAKHLLSMLICPNKSQKEQTNPLACRRPEKSRG